MDAMKAVVFWMSGEGREKLEEKESKPAVRTYPTTYGTSSIPATTKVPTRDSIFLGQERSVK